MSARERLPEDGPGAPPRRNGTLEFEAPWESRAFGLAVSLCDRGFFGWEEFRRHLIEEIAGWEASHRADEAYSYYARWLAALEKTLAEQGLFTQGEFEGRLAELAARPHGHDH
ncbi:MAG: nitrile hydratase accessory protein [Myxococcota bacterium]